MVVLDLDNFIYKIIKNGQKNLAVKKKLNEVSKVNYIYKKDQVNEMNPDKIVEMEVDDVMVDKISYNIRKLRKLFISIQTGCRRYE